LPTLRKLPEKMKQSAQHNVTWQTSSEYCRLMVPSGRTLNYVLFAWKILFWNYMGPPSYCWDRGAIFFDAQPWFYSNV